MATAGAPRAAADSVSVWTGKEMIVWGGVDYSARISLGSLPSVGAGGRYDPGTDTWKILSPTNAPATRTEHRGVWTGREFLIWGGHMDTDTSREVLDSGARYNPVSDTWATLTIQNAPSRRVNSSAVWTGEAMLIFGGYPGSGVNGFDSNHAWIPGRTLYLYEKQ